MRIAIAVMLLVATAWGANAQRAWRQECKGVLQVGHDGGHMIAVPPEGLCEIGVSEAGKVMAWCAVGRFCRVYGWAESCKDSGECSEITKVLSARPN